MELLANQVFAFAATVVIGMAAGFCYDYYSVIREVLRLNKLGTWLGDMIFWLAITALVFAMLLWGNRGDVRLYVFIGLGLGALIYFRIFSSAVRRTMRFKFFLLQKTWELLVKALIFVWAVMVFPFRLLALIISYPLNFFKGLLAGAGRKLRAAVYNFVGKRLEQRAVRLKARLSGMAFWREKK